MPVPEGRTLEFRTPENVGFTLTLAGPAARSVAWVVDLLVVATASGMISGTLGIVGFVSRDLAAAAGLIAYFSLSVGYGMAMEWLCRGQTLGKRVMRLRVLDAEGLKLGLHQVVIRNLFRPLDILPALYLVGGLFCLFTRKQQRLGDLAAGTLVIRETSPGRPDLGKAAASKFNSLLRHRHLAARLRQLVTPEEAAIALQALIRRDELEAGERVRLFKELREHFAGKVPFPAEAEASLPDEQYVRNVVELLRR